MTLGYVCKYTPVELLNSLGIHMKRLSPEVLSFPQADIALHPNVCSYAKAVFEDAAAAFDQDPELSGIILTTCCDSIRRLYDALRKAFPDRFFYLLDVPRAANDFAAELYAAEMERFLSALREKFGDTMSSEGNPSLKEESLSWKPAEDAPKIGILGARANPAVYRILKEHHARILFDMTCTGITREIPLTEDRKEYAFHLLNQFPCMRMANASGRRDALSGFSGQLDGILYHTVKFCDNFSFEYAEYKKTSDVPLLAIETDATTGSEGQIRTRMEAFLEEINMKKRTADGKTVSAEDGTIRYVLGIDSGSTSTNAVIMNSRREIVAYEVIRTGAKSMESARKAFDAVLQKAGLKREDLSRIISTGYGRVSIDFADENVTEISCHGMGAHYFNPAVRTILDIGGQDSKAIRIDEKGDVVDFVMNDKCAAGTGRFLEAMARTLEIPVDQLGPISLGSGKNVPISSMCTVFAESEVISLIARNEETADIAMGLHRAIAGKAMGLLRKVGIEETVMMTGGVAKNPGVIKALEEHLPGKLYIPEEPEIVGAVGAAVYGLT